VNFKLAGGLPALWQRRLLTPAKMRSGLAVTQAGGKAMPSAPDNAIMQPATKKAGKQRNSN